jgi:phosphoglycolate phosphatase
LIDRRTAAPRLGPRSVAGLVFDLDGTLIDSYPAIVASLNHARASFGLTALDADLIRRRVGRGLETLVAELVGPGPAEVEQGTRVYREHYARTWAGGTRALPGAERAVRALAAAGYALAVASNKPARFSRPILEHLGFADCFRSIQGPDLAGSTKPDPAMIERCLQELQLAPERALYVGDMVLDVESAAAAGLRVILVTGGSSSREDLLATGQPVVADLSELCRLLACPLPPPGS